MSCEACRHAEIKAFIDPPKCHHPEQGVRPNHPPLPPGCPFLRQGKVSTFFTFPGLLFPYKGGWSGNIYLDDIKAGDPVRPVIASIAAEYWTREKIKWALVPVNDCKNFDDIAGWKAEAEKNAEAWRRWEKGEDWE